MPAEALRRAVMFAGDFSAVVEAVARDGASALSRFDLRPLVPIEPMLAAQAESLEEALADLAPAAVEWKLDGVRVQLHRAGGEVRVFSRQLRDVTSLVPELVTLGLRLPSERFILDGEVIALGEGGRPIAFQDLMSRFSREDDETASPGRAMPGPAMRGRATPGRATPGAPTPGPATPRPPTKDLVALFFDVLHVDGETLVDRPYRARREALERLVPEAHRVRQRRVETAEEAERMLQEALAAGHEGVMIKGLETPYAAGRRGAQWRKLKPAVSLDLVILAAEWGHGRRRGFLSNLHLGARVPSEEAQFVMLGKTFKGLTDAMLQELTVDLLGIATRRDAHVVHVQPVRVVEIAFDAVQRSPRYDSGFALRFARVKRFRPDKSAVSASTLDEVREIHARQSRR